MAHFKQEKLKVRRRQLGNAIPPNTFGVSMRHTPPPGLILVYVLKDGSEKGGVQSFLGPLGRRAGDVGHDSIWGGGNKYQFIKGWSIHNGPLYSNIDLG